jgi:hypothetical protein
MSGKLTKAAFDRSRARLEILSYVTSFCLTHVWGDGKEKQTRGSLHGFRSGMFEDKPVVGDLVVLQSAPVSKWYLSWLREIKEENGWTHYLLESIDDGQLGWWHNVSLDFFEREELATFASWRWTDRQFAFKDRWWRVCYREKDAYITLPVFPVFGEDNSVTLGTRTRHGFDDHRPTKTFPDWRKVTKAMMAEFYDEAVAGRTALSSPNPETRGGKT